MRSHILSHPAARFRERRFMKPVRRFGAFLALALIVFGPAPALGQSADASKEAKKGAKDTAAAKEKSLSDRFDGLEFRTIGPFRGGRVTAVAGVRREPQTFYMGATGGGVWKTTDGGSNLEGVSDKGFQTGSIGAIAGSASEPHLVRLRTRP